MPLKLIKKAGSPFWYVRGVYVGVRVHRTTQAADKAAANRILATWRKQIERGEYRHGTVEQVDEPTTFAQATLAYLNAGGDGRFLAKPVQELGRVPLNKIDQLCIDAAAVRAYPNASPATRNRCFYTPVSAVLRHVGVKLELRRPKGWRGKRSTSWLDIEQAFAAMEAAMEVNAEFGLLCKCYLYTGRRQSEWLDAPIRDLNLLRQTLLLPDPKNGDPVLVHLPPPLVLELANHPRGLDRPPDEKIFRFHNSGRLRNMLKATWRRAGIVLPRRQAGFHVFCRTWATWMRKYGELDTYGLVRTRRWKDPSMAASYDQFETSEAARRADLLPWPTKRSA